MWQLYLKNKTEVVGGDKEGKHIQAILGIFVFQLKG